MAAAPTLNGRSEEPIQGGVDVLDLVGQLISNLCRPLQKERGSRAREASTTDPPLCRETFSLPLHIASLYCGDESPPPWACGVTGHTAIRSSSALP